MIHNQPIADLSLEQRIALESALLGKRVPAQRQPAIPRLSRPDPIPLSFAQQRFWFLDRLMPDSSAYNIPKGIRLKGPLNLSAFRNALDAIVARHESLRTTFVSIDGNPAQVILEKSGADFSFLDLSGLPADTREEEVQRRFREEYQRPFDLTRGPLFRAQCVRVSPEDHALFLNAHHIVFDGWSIGVLFRELTALYRAFSGGTPSKLADLPIQYADYAIWQRQRLQGEVLESQLSYWKKQLGEGHAVLELPIDHPRSSEPTFGGAAKAIHLPQLLSESLRSLSRQEGVTLFITLLAAFQTLLYRYTGRDYISVGSPIAGRNRSELEDLIGLFVNMLVLRTDLSGNPTFRELLHRVREVLVGAEAHQDIPFEKLVEELHPQRDKTSTPFFQVLLTLANGSEEEFDFPGLSISPLNAGVQKANFDLHLSVVNGHKGMRASFSYKTDLFESETITRMLGHFQVLLESIVAEPDRRILDLPLLTEAERQTMLVDWNSL